MNIQITEYPRCDLVKMAGRVDTYTAPNLEDAMEKLVENKRTNIVFDMSEVDFLSSRGIHALIELQRKCRSNNGKIVLAATNDRIFDSFKLIVMDGYFDFFDDVNQALESF